MKKTLFAIIGVHLLLVMGCTQNLLYRIDVQQGNVVTMEAFSRLKPGMTPRQVEFLLGTPLVHDDFTPDRWDYVYYYRHSFEEPEIRRLTLWFEENRLSRIEGDMPLEEREYLRGSTLR